jgi:hypothetical protein
VNQSHRRHVSQSSLIEFDNLADDAKVSGSLSYFYSAPANGDLKAASISFSGSLSGSYDQPSEGLSGAVISGAVFVDLDGNSFTGTLSGSSKLYGEGGVNKKATEQPETIQLEGSFKLKSGEAIVGKIVSKADFTGVDFSSPTAETNFGTGFISAKLELSDLSKSNQGVISLDLIRNEFLKGTATLKIELGQDVTKRWIAITSTGLLDTSDKPFDYLPAKTISNQNGSINISSSGGFKGTFNNAGTTDIFNADSVKVGEIKNGQLFIGGSITPVFFD